MKYLLSMFGAILLAVCLSCFEDVSLAAPAQAVKERSSHKNYRDIPGVTPEEIAAIQTLQKRTTPFVYGLNLSAEAFYGANKEIGGFGKLFCDWLTTLFQIPFKLGIYEWGDLVSGLESHKIDFTGDLTATPERRQKYLMTDAIAERPVKFMRIEGSESLEQIAKTRPLRYAFLEGTTTLQQVLPFIGNAKVIQLDDYSIAYRMLKDGEVDAFFDEGGAEAAFDDYGDVTAEPFFPLLLSPVSLATQNPELAPIISVVQKALQSGNGHMLAQLYNLGYREYLRNKLFMQLTEEEMEYVREHREADKPVLFAGEYDNYPVSFFNGHENKWQGIAYDVLDEISAFTGIKFSQLNEKLIDWEPLLQMLEDGKVSMITELLPSKEREGRFLNADVSFQTDYYALLSRLDYPDLSINEILYARIGLLNDTAYSLVFHSWFPGHKNTVEYNNTPEALDALERGEVDLVMGSRNLLLGITNFEEQPGFKANLVFNYRFGSTFGFNKRESVLASIISKAMRLVDTKSLSEHWIHKVFDYRAKIAEAQRPWLIGFLALTACMLALLAFIFLRRKQEATRLRHVVRERTRQLETVIGNYDGVIWSINKDNIITTFNGLYLKTIGVTPAFLEGKSLNLALQKKRHLDIIERVEETMRTGTGQDWTAGIDGRMYRSRTRPMYDDAGNVIGVVGCTDDITESLALQRDLEKAVAAAEAASRAKSDFLSNMSHEMRTPMNAIIGMTSIGKNAANIERKNYAFGKIEDASSHLLGVINDILDMSKIEAGKFELSPVEFFFEKALHHVVNVINFRVNEKHQRLTVHIDKNIPPSLVGDDQRLAQVITNLLGNAVKFTPEHGSIRIEAHYAGESDGLVTVRIAVSDTGIGITDEQRGRLFSVFQQAESSTTRRFGGTGLGLAISKRIVEMMGGEIWVTSEPDKGSTFIFTIRVERGTKKYACLSSAKYSLRTLAVDDMQDAQEYFADISERLGFACDVVGSGEQALNMIELNGPYDVYFVDWKMPGMGGMELSRRIKARADGDRATVVMMSSMEWSILEDEAREAGVDKFLAKPLFPSAIADCINECLGLAGLPIQEAMDAKERFDGKCLLLAEDVEVNREIVLTLLEPTMLRIECAENGAVAVNMFRDAPERYNMIFMDVQMPEMDGYAATRAIRALDITWAKEVPIIAMTANVFREDIERCLAAGMNDHVGKPLNLDAVLEKLHTYLSASEGG